MNRSTSEGPAPGIGGSVMLWLTRVYEAGVGALIALIPMSAIGYLSFFQDPDLRFQDHGFHETAISVSILLSAFVAYVTWRCYASTGEPFLRWLTLGFAGFAVVYAPHGALTRMADHNMWLFLLYGPASRLVMAGFLFAGLLHYGQPPHPPARRIAGWGTWFVLLALADAVIAVIAHTSVAGHPVVRLSMEYGALALSVMGIATMLVRRIGSPLMAFYLLALCCFAQSSIGFVLARPWNHLWWVAHAVFAGGFFLLSYGVVRAFHTTRSFSAVHSQEEMMAHLAAAKATAEQEKAKAEESLAQLRAVQATLIESEKMAALGGLVAGVAHEINTPVGIVVSSATHLEAETTATARLYAAGDLDGDGLEGYFDTALQASRLMTANSTRAADLIQSFKRVAVDQTAGEERSFDLAGYIDEVLASLRPRLKGGQHRVEVDCPPDLTLTSNPGALAQILTNLITNSLVHGCGPDGNVHIRIAATATTRPDADSVELVYTDAGAGIPTDLHARVFEPFFTTRRGAGGSGLGLHIVYNLVTSALKGTIRLASAPGEGVRFTIRIPRSLDAAEPVGTGQPEGALP